MTDFTMTTDADGVATITWDTVGRSMNVMTLAGWDELDALVVASVGVIDGVILQLVVTGDVERCERGLRLAIRAFRGWVGAEARLDAAASK